MADVESNGKDHTEIMETVSIDDCNEQENGNNVTASDGSNVGETVNNVMVDRNSDHTEMHNEIQIEPSGTVTSKSVDLSERVQNIKNWGVNTFMRTKQIVKEKLSRTSRTVNVDLEDRIEILRLQQGQYKLVVANNSRIVEQLRQLLGVHQYSVRLFAELAQTEKEMAEAFLSRSQVESSCLIQVKELIDKILASTAALETLVNKTFGDAFEAIHSFDTARVEYDAYKTETARLLTQLQQKSNVGPNDQIKLQEMQDNLEQKRLRYENCKTNIVVKLDLLEDNKRRVVQRELLNSSNAWYFYHSECLELFSGTKQVIMKQSSVRSDNDDVGDKQSN